MFLVIHPNAHCFRRHPSLHPTLHLVQQERCAAAALPIVCATFGWAVGPEHSVITRQKNWPEWEISTFFFNGNMWLYLCSQMSRQNETSDGNFVEMCFKASNTQQSHTIFNANLWRTNAKTITFFLFYLTERWNEKLI